MSYLKIVCRLVMIAMLVLVPAAIAAPALAAPATQGTMGKTKPPAPKPDLLDINTATKEQLATLPASEMPTPRRSSPAVPTRRRTS